jgi:hypothetical protein
VKRRGAPGYKSIAQERLGLVEGSTGWWVSRRAPIGDSQRRTNSSFLFLVLNLTELVHEVGFEKGALESGGRLGLTLEPGAEFLDVLVDHGFEKDLLLSRLGDSLLFVRVSLFVYHRKAQPLAHAPTIIVIRAPSQ